MDSLGAFLAPDTVRLERLLPGPIERVWRYVVDDEKRRLWLTGGGGEIDLKVGGKVHMILDNRRFAEPGDLPPPKYAQLAGESHIRGHVTACEPPYLFAYLWDHGAEEPFEVTIELEPRGDKVLLVLTHARATVRGELVAVSAGWHTFLDILEARLADEKAPSYWRRMGELEARYENTFPLW